MTENILNRVWRVLVRMDVVVLLIILILLLAALGSCFPQQPTYLDTDPNRVSLWEANARVRYGGLTNLLNAIGAFQFFHTPTFRLSLVLLVTSTLLCTLNRWKALWHRVVKLEVRCTDAIFNIAPYTTRLSRIGDVDVSTLLKKKLTQRGFRVHSTIDRGFLHLRGDRNHLSPLATLISHLGVVLLLLGTLLSSALGWKEELTIKPNQSANLYNLPEVMIRHEGFTIERYPDGSAADYESLIVLSHGEQEIARRSLSLNDPLSFDGVSFLLYGFSVAEGDYTLTILASFDPGRGPVFSAGFLLLIGFTVRFNFPHCSIHAQLGPDGTLKLAGRAERRACDFGREFTTLVDEISQGIQNQ